MAVIRCQTPPVIGWPGAGRIVRAMSGRRHVCFGMYPFPAVRPAWEAFVAALHERLPWVPDELDWDEDVHASWRDDTCVVSHACGFPLVTQLAGHVRVLGAFRLAIPDARHHEYRSVLLARRPARPEDLARPDAVAAANGPESLSGWVSLVTATVGAGGAWPGRVVWTGAHAASLQALRDGAADVASIDALTLAHLRVIEPSCVDGLHVIGHGPWVPSTPVVVRASATDAEVEACRRAIGEVLADPRFAPFAAALLVDGFVPLESTDYEPLLALTPGG